MVTSATHRGAAKAGVMTGVMASVMSAAMAPPRKHYNCNATGLP
jgi:hypothetical protein